MKRAACYSDGGQTIEEKLPHCYKRERPPSLLALRSGCAIFTLATKWDKGLSPDKRRWYWLGQGNRTYHKDSKRNHNDLHVGDEVVAMKTIIKGTRAEV
eukprot:6103862-Amphidinium_carterae.1